MADTDTILALLRREAFNRPLGDSKRVVMFFRDLHSDPLPHVSISERPRTASEMHDLYRLRLRIAKARPSGSTLGLEELVPALGALAPAHPIWLVTISRATSEVDTSVVGAFMNSALDRVYGMIYFEWKKLNGCEN